MVTELTTSVLVFGAETNIAKMSGMVLPESLVISDLEAMRQSPHASLFQDAPLASILFRPAIAATCSLYVLLTKGRISLIQY